MKAFCSECKCCEAQDGFELCIFCEDGVPCPNRQRAARPAITTTPAHITPLAPKKPGHPRNPNSPWRGNAGLYLGNNAPLKAAPTNSAVTLQEEASEPQAVDEAAATQEKLPTVDSSADATGFDGWLAEKNRYREKRKQIKERNPMTLTDAERATRKVCPCGKLLRKDNTDGLCKVCRKAAKKDASVNGTPARRGRPRSKATPPRNSSSKIAAPESGAATLHVTESHLNNFLLKLSLDEKTAIVQRHLEGV